jgi:hypothetical protein
MRTFKVLVIGHQLKNQVIAKFGDLVDENQLLGNADELVKAGFVEEILEAKKGKKSEESESAEIEVESPEILEAKKGKK